MSLMSLLGESLRKPDGSTVSTKEALGSREIVALYFSAHWCPPCRGFTPALSEKYTALKKADKDFECVFVSSDKSNEAFEEYHNEMTFLALPFADRDAKAKLSKKFKVSGIPTLVFYDLKEDKLITTDGREAVSSEKFIEEFPYRPTPVDVVATLGPSLRKPDGSTVDSSEALAGKDYLGLYFSAHWCPPCRGFTPTLSERYTALQKAGKSFELVFVSSDRDEAAFAEYHKEMSFLALPFELREEKGVLSKHFKVQGIPSLVFLELSTGKLITDSARGGISADSFVEDFPYHPKPLNDLSESTDGINDSVSLVVLMEAASREQKEATTEMLSKIADEELAKPEDSLVFEKFFTGKGGGPLAQIRSGCGYSEAPEGGEPVMLVLNLDDEGAYYHPEADRAVVNESNVRAFMKAYADGSLQKNTFGQKS